MTTALITHPDCANHLTPAGHPESPARLAAVLQALEGDAFKALMRVAAPLGRDADILRAHPRAYLDHIRASAPQSGSATLDPDTFMTPGSLRAARRGVGAAVRGVDLVLAVKASNAFCATRPPGHHAEKSTPMRFCLFGTIAIAAKYAIAKHGLSRIAVVDFDVHHGNGTQDLLWDEERVLFISSHEMPLYPGTGDADETGAHGQIMNLPLTAGTDGSSFRRCYENLVLPAIDTYAPELILISAGFDAHRADPLANLALEDVDFAWITGRLCDLADKHCKGRIVSTLEGGYDLQALAAASAAHIRVLMERGQ